MRYGQMYALANTSEKLINDTLALVDTDKMLKGFTEPEKNIDSADKNAVLVDSRGSSARNANVQFVYDRQIMSRWLSVANTINKDIEWNLELDAIENIQYGEYNEEQYYDWHIDQHKVVYGDGRVRKCSFSVFLNDDYEGGEFDLELGGPNIEDRLKTFKKLPKNQMIFFQSEFWHRVRPVTKGVRKSLVGWVLGPKYK